MVAVSFVGALALFTFVGISSSLFKKKKTSDYLLAGRSVSPLFVGLSAAASWCSGFMFIGQIGFTYQRGLSSIWIMLGLILGDIFVSLITHKKLRESSQEKKQESFVEALLESEESHQSGTYKLSAVIVSIIALISLVGYSSAQIMSSGIALESILEIDYKSGAILTTALITLYCFSGGIRASIWTDFAQSLVMLFSLMMLVGTSFIELGGLGEWIVELKNSSPSFLSVFPPDIHKENILYLLFILLGWFAGGMGVAGQPHVMVRFMTLNDVKLINRAKAYYYFYYILLYLLAILIGLSAKLILPELEASQYEMALPLLAKTLLPDFLIGVILAGLFASTMSTADSLIISSSATLTRDLIPKLKNSYTAVKLSTLLIATMACAIAISSQKTVFQMVIIFGGLLSASFAPILILKSLNFNIGGRTLIAMLLTSALSVTLWRELGYSYLTYEVAVGMFSALVTGVIGSKLTTKR